MIILTSKKMVKSILFRLIIYTAAIMMVQSAHAQDTLPPVSIGVSHEAVADGVLYVYQVTNKSDYPLTSVVIGLDYFSGKAMLKTAPVGWTVNSGIPTSSVYTPEGWTAQIIPTEDTDLLQLEWDVSTQDAAIAPGATQIFNVLVPQADNTYADSKWTVYVNSPNVAYYSSQLVPTSLPCDTPKISVVLNPDVLWPPNHKLVTINATVSVQDLLYPNPTVRLVSITSNEPLGNGDVIADFGTPAQTFQVKSERKGKDKAGRVYTVTYSATNSCGNTATASENVVVPHNQ